MALAKRIIPCLDVDKGRVVKGVNFVGIRDAGDPVEVAKRYNEQGADEMVFFDITASAHGRGTMVDVMEQVASRCFMPLTVGGGIRTVEDMGIKRKQKEWLAEQMRVRNRQQTVIISDEERRLNSALLERSMSRDRSPVDRSSP